MNTKKVKVAVSILFSCAVLALMIVYFTQFSRVASTSSDSLLASVAGGGLTTTTGGGDSTKKACEILAVNGTNSDGTFGDAIEGLTKDYDKMTVTKKSYNDAVDAGSYVSSEVPSIRSKHPKSKILVASHSSSAIGVFNIMGNLKSKATFQLYDPPYNFPFSGSISAKFNSNAREIKKARDAGISSATELIDWTGGFDKPTDATEKKNHEKYKDDNQALSKVTSWLKDNCTKKNS